MASSAFDTFTCFSHLPAELQKEVWEQAASDPPAVDIQQFTAELVLSEQIDNQLDEAHAVLCFKPHPGFIKLTAGYRGLFEACQESRKAAKRLINCLIPIYYPKMGDDGNVAVRQAMVPFDPSGRFCITSLARAMTDPQSGEYEVPRGSLPRGIFEHKIQVFGDTVFPIKNLMITLESDRPEECSVYSYMGGWGGDRSFEFIASRLPNLKMVSLVGEAILDRRHYLDQSVFDRLCQSTTVKPKHERGDHEEAAPWQLLWDKWKRQQFRFYHTTWTKIVAMERDDSRN